MSEEAAVAERRSSVEPDFPLSGPKLAKGVFPGMVLSLAGVRREAAAEMKQTRPLRAERAVDAKRPHGTKE